VTIVLAIIVLGIIIFFHELGHFLVAKFTGIRVEKFSIGFPPKLVGKKIGETEYQIGAIPFGGFVRLAGEEHPEGEEPQPYEFLAKPPRIRILVLLAGPIMNLLMGLILVWTGFIFHGESNPLFDKAEVGGLIPGMPASEAGLMVGDVILKVDGDTVSNWNELSDEIHSKPDTSVVLVILRKDSVFNLECQPESRKVSLESGDTVFGMIGIIWQSEQTRLPAGTAFIRSIEATYMFSGAVLGFIWSLIVGESSLKDIGGPVMITRMTGETAKMGLWPLLLFVAALAINLGILNLLPIPVLDGGQILFTVIEAIRKKRISDRVRSIFQQVSMLLLLGLMAIVTIKDVIDLF